MRDSLNKSSLMSENILLTYILPLFVTKYDIFWCHFGALEWRRKCYFGAFILRAVTSQKNALLSEQKSVVG